MSTSGRDDAREAANLVDEYGGLRPFVERFGVGGILFAIFVNTIDAINAMGELILAPFRATAAGIVSLIDSTVGNSLDIIAAGASTAINSIESGLTAILGPLAFPFAVLIVMIAVAIFLESVDRISFSPTLFVFGR